MKYPKNLEYAKASQDASDNLGMSTKATIAEFNESIMDEFGVKYSKDGRKLLEVPCELDVTYSIKEGTKIICNWAFYNCRSLFDIVIPDGVTSIGYGAFWRCNSLNSVVIPDSANRFITLLFLMA